MGFDADDAGNTGVKRTSSGRRPSMYSEDHNDSVLRTVEIITPDVAHAAAAAGETRNDADGHPYTKEQVRSNITSNAVLRYSYELVSARQCAKALRRPPPLAHTPPILYFFLPLLPPHPPPPRPPLPVFPSPVLQFVSHYGGTKEWDNAKPVSLQEFDDLL